jgi:Carboxypeptidase regulatory-like domain
MNRHFCVLVVLALVLSALPLAAQSSSLQGVITDPQGAIVPGAIVTITNTDTSAVRREPTDEDGVFRLLQVVPGPYKIEIQKPGFKTRVTNLALQINQPATLNLQLDVGQTSDTVNVTAETTQINTQNATVGNPFNTEQVENLPLQTRNIASLLLVQPGVTSTGNVMGSQAGQTYITLDGVDVNGFNGSSTVSSTSSSSGALPIPLDSVQEFRTTVIGQGADMGRSSGGQVSIITKSGSNSFHGSLYEFNRNTDFEANDFFNNKVGTPRPALIRNQYGASLGGPIKKNRAFFFYNYEGRKDRSQATKKDTVPTDSLKQGIVKIALQNNQIVSLTPAQMQQIDPLGIGENPYILSLMQKYPEGNAPSLSSDKGLNFNVLQFNAPSPLDNHVQVGKMDFNLDKAGKQTLSLRGTLNGASQVSTTAQFPGQDPVAKTQDNSRGVSARYTYVVSPNLVNAMNFGYTRAGTASTGSLNVAPNFGFTTLAPTTRASRTFSPVYNYTNDLSWNKGRHTFQFGANISYKSSVSNSYTSSEPSYSVGTGSTLGGDVTADVLSYLQKSIPGAALNSSTNVIAAFGAVFGILSSGSATYNYGLNGNVIPFGAPITRAFASTTSEFYAQDAWKAKPNLTITYGLRYSIYGAPYETDGVQVSPNISPNQYFADRQFAASAGIPNYALASSYITYTPAGPVNKGPGYYPVRYNNFGPRLGAAYSPKGWLATYLGSGSVLRASYGLVYDNYGNSLASSLASGGTPGLTNAVAQAANTNFSTSPRYVGTAGSLPVLAAPPSGITFPYTPPLAQGGYVTFSAVSADLKAPYEHLLSATYARPLPKHLSLEVGYAGRLSHRGILTADYGQPLSQFVDPKSGQSWQQAAMVLANLYYTGAITPASVKANPSLVPLQPFVQNTFPGAANLYIPGSATANLFYFVYQQHSGSWLDSLNGWDRTHMPGGGSANGGCLSIYGCNTFFTTQFSTLATYVNAGHAAYNAAIVTLRRTVTGGWGFDFNYTWSHAIDNGIGGTLQNAFVPSQGLGPASFDMRHQVTSDFVVDVPVGKGKLVGRNMPKWANAVFGGWQTSGLYTFHTGVPVNCTASIQYNVNYEQSSLCIPYPGLATPPSRGLGLDQLGYQSAYRNTNAGNDFVPSYAGVAGYNGLARGWAFWNLDAAVNKNFSFWQERIRATIRVEAYNVLNKEVFSNSAMSITPLQPGLTTTGLPSEFGNAAFGEITSSQSTPRVLQAVLRFTF